MKIHYLLSILFIAFLTSCSKAQKYDFESVTTSAQADSILQKMRADGLKVPNSEILKELNFEGMHYGGISLLSAEIYNNRISLKVDTSEYAAKKMLEKIDSQKGIGILTTSFSDRNFKWDEEYQDSALHIYFKDGKNLVSMGANDAATFSVTFKNRYESPLANIHHKIEPSEEKPPVYVLNIDSNSTFYSVSINGVNLVSQSNYSNDEDLSPFVFSSYFSENDFILNPFILGENMQTITIDIAPTKDLNNKAPSFSASASFGAKLYDKTSGKTIDILETMHLENKKATTFNLELNPNLPVYTSGWKDGVDLREIPDLKEKVIAVFNALGNAIINQDEKAYSDLLYAYRYEKQQSLFITDFKIARENWESDSEMLSRTYKHTLSKNFDLKFSDDGKLVYAVPNDQFNMLFLTGKKYSNDFNFFLYLPKDGTDLKIIR